jgi:drug/metabolite transporter (DMT)-like permease
MNPADALGGMSALVAATVWGGGDFLGGLATRQRNPFQILAIGSLSGLICLGIAAAIRNEVWPDGSSILWSAAAGLAGAIGIASLYQGLAKAEMARVAPTSAVVSVILPVALNAILSGPFAGIKWLGIAAGLAGILMIHGWPAEGQDQEGLALAILSGLGFGGFFVLIAQVQLGSLFFPLVISKAVELVLAVVIVMLGRSRPPLLIESPLPFAAGICDAGGNVFYLLASQLTRFGLAAVISSMSPAITVLLARVIIKQHLKTVQNLGVVLCLIGVGLIVSG